jgi:UDP-N-acetylglucosamine/UDP-N-acetylgalactosamine 4-epimerase
MHIFITGGAGFIGSHLAEYLLSINYTVTVFDNLTTGKKENIQEFVGHPNFNFIFGDILDYDLLLQSTKNADCICHQAALVSVPKSINDPLLCHNLNVNGFLNLLLCAKQNNIKRIVYASSSAVYGDNQLSYKIEEQIGKHMSPYAVTKFIDEIYAKMFYDIYNIECIGLRYFNVFGPKQDPNGPYAAVIPKFILNIKNGIDSIINGDGSQTRDFVFVDNVVHANFLALTTNNNECFGQVFNIGSGHKITILELFNLINLNTTSITSNKEICSPIFGPERIGDILHSCADISKAQNYLNYIPSIDLKNGLLKTINFYI